MVDEERKEEDQDTISALDNDNQAAKTDEDDSNGGHVTRIHADRYLQAYRHRPKAEDPLYRTSQNVIGAKPPSTATLVTERHSIQQNFSNSFGQILYSNQVRGWV